MTSQQVIPPHIAPDADGTFDSHYYAKAAADALLAAKANQTALDTTNANVTANATAIASKADTSYVDAQDATKQDVATLETAVANSAAVKHVDPGTAGALGQFMTIGPLGPAWLDAPIVNAKHPRFGAKGDGTTDDTAALQAWVTYCVTNMRAGYLPAGTYRITARLNIPLRPQWSLLGAGPNETVIRQDTDNTPILFMGSDTASSGHSWAIRGIGFDYLNSQPTANTSANPITFDQMWYNGALTDCFFAKGVYGLKLTRAVTAPWGCILDNLTFGAGLTGGAIDFNIGVGGCPNNHWGKFYIDAHNMAGPTILAYGYNWVIDCLEWNAANLGPVLFRTHAGSEIVIGAMKLENGTYAANQTLFDFLANSSVDIGHLTVGGNAVVINSGVKVQVISGGSGGGNTGHINVRLLRIGGSTLTGLLYGVNTSATAVTGGISIGDFISQDVNARLQDVGSTVSADGIRVESYVNGRVSANKGDADYTVALRDPNIVTYQTAFTAPRTITLPTDGDNMHNGLYYRIVVNGAINGTNTLTIKAGTTTLRTLSSDKVALVYTWRRHPTPASGWMLTAYETLP